MLHTQRIAACVRAVAAFWKAVKNEKDWAVLSQWIENIDHHDQQAVLYFHKILVHFPQSIQELKLFANFLLL